MYASTLSYDTSVPPPGEDVRLTDYDGFATVQEPKQYLDAPAMLMTRLDDIDLLDNIEFPDDSIGSTSNGDSHTWSGVGTSHSQADSRAGSAFPENMLDHQPGVSTSIRLSAENSVKPKRQSSSANNWLATVGDNQDEAVRCSLEAAASYTVLSNREFRECLAETEALESRMAEVAHILDVENKMHQAADSLSRIDITEQSSTNQAPRSHHKSHSKSPNLSSLQKTLSPSRTSKRVSQWFSPSHAPPSPKPVGIWSPHAGRTGSVNDSPRIGLGVSSLEHRNGHKRNASSTSQMAIQEMALSESHIQQLTYAHDELRRRKTVLDCRIAQHHAALLSRASHPTSEYCHTKPESVPEFSSTSFKEEGDLEAVTAKLLELAPTITPVPDRAKFIQAAVQWLVNDCENEHKKADALRAQADVSEQRINFLAAELSRVESNQPASIEPEVAQIKAERAQVMADYIMEQQRCAEYRLRVETQRGQLEAVVRALEDVTSLAVGFERERAEMRALIQDLEERLEQTEKKAAHAQATLLPENALPGALSKAYREIIHEVVLNHAAELRKARRLRLSAQLNSNLAVLDAAALAASDISKSLESAVDWTRPVRKSVMEESTNANAGSHLSPSLSSPDSAGHRTGPTPKIPPRKRMSIQSPDDLL